MTDDLQRQISFIKFVNQTIAYEMKVYDKVTFRNPHRAKELGDRKSYLQKIVDMKRIQLVERLDEDIFDGLLEGEITITNIMGFKVKKYLFYSTHEGNQFQ